MRSIKIAAVAVFAGLGLATSANADLLAMWTFETSAPTGSGSSNGPYTAEAGLNAAASFASGLHASDATVWSNPVGNGSGESFSSNNWGISDFYQFTTSTTGFQDLVVSWDQTRSSTGPSDFVLQVSADGTTFSNAGAYVVPVVSWSSSTPDATGTSSFSQNLSSFGVIEDDSSVFFRLVATSAPSGTAGTNRVDNFAVNASAIPEPASLALLGLGGLGLLRRRRM